MSSRTDYAWAKAMGYTGPQLADSAGVSVGEYICCLLHFNKALTMHGSGSSAKPTEEYKYLDGRCRHYKLIGRLLFGSIVLAG